MWEHLKSEQKEKYKTLITNFASLSQAFSQKAESENEGQTENYVAPIVNYSRLNLYLRGIQIRLQTKFQMRFWMLF